MTTQQQDRRRVLQEEVRRVNAEAAQRGRLGLAEIARAKPPARDERQERLSQEHLSIIEHASVRLAQADRARAQRLTQPERITLPGGRATAPNPEGPNADDLQFQARVAQIRRERGANVFQRLERKFAPLEFVGAARRGFVRTALDQFGKNLPERLESPFRPSRVGVAGEIAGSVPASLFFLGDEFSDVLRGRAQERFPGEALIFGLPAVGPVAVTGATTVAKAFSPLARFAARSGDLGAASSQFRQARTSLQNLTRGAPTPARPSRAIPMVSGAAVERPGIQQTLSQAGAIVDRDSPGTLTRILDYIPGPRQIQGELHPSLRMPKTMTTGWVGQGLAIADVGAGLERPRLAQLRAIEGAFGKGATTTRDFKPANIRFLGTAEQAKYPYTGTMADIMARPSLYDLSQGQRAVLASVQEARSGAFEVVREAYGLDIGQFPVEAGGVHLPNVDISEKALDVSGNIQSALRRGRTKERFYNTAAERWANDATFRPETKISGLLEANDQTLANMAGHNVFQVGAGGRTKLQVMEELHPALARKMQALQRRLNSLRATTERLGGKQTEVIDDFLTSTLDDVELTALQADLNVTVGANAVGREGVNFGKDLATMRREVAAVKRQIADLRPSWRVANLSPYARVQEAGNLLFRAEDAQQIRRLLKVSESRVLRFIDNLRATAFGGDFSPITIQGQMAWASDPIGAARFLAKGHGTLTQQAMLKLWDADPAGWQRFVRTTGINPLVGTVDPEFAVGFIGKIPKVGQLWTKFNEAMYRPITSLQKDIFEDLYQRGIRQHHLTPEQAAAVAGDGATKVIPRVNFRRLGQSQAEAARYRAALTSVSFLTQPAALLIDATKGVLKLGTLQNITPSESFAVRRVVTLMVTLEAISVLTNVYHAKTNDLDVEQAIKDSLNPKSSSFLAAVLPDGSRIGLGGPFRSMIRAMVPRTIPGVPVPVPFAGIVQFIRGKVGPGYGIAYDFLRNKDFYDRQIVTGNFPINVIQGLAYAAEGSLPLALGTTAQEARQGASGSRIRSQAASQFLGANLSPQSLRDVRDAVLWELHGLHLSSNEVTPKMLAEVEEDPRVQEKKAERARQAGPLSPPARALDLQNDTKAFQLADDALFENGDLTGPEWRQNRAVRRADLFSRREEIHANAKYPRKDRGILDDYSQVITEAKAAHNGVLTGDAWDDVDRWTQEQSEEVQAFLEEQTGVGSATPTEKRFRTAQKALKPYWDILDNNSLYANNPDVAELYDLWRGGNSLEFLQPDPFTERAMRRIRGQVEDAQLALLEDNPQMDVWLVEYYGRSPKTLDGRMRRTEQQRTFQQRRAA